MSSTEKTILLGADPSFVNFGLALYWPNGKKMILNSGDIMSMVNWIQPTLKVNGASLKNVIAFVEDPNLDSTVFNMWAIVETEVEAYTRYRYWVASGRKGKAPRQTTMSDVRSAYSRCMKIAQDVGKNKGAASLFMTMLHKAKVPYIQIAPSSRNKAFKKNASGGTVRQDVRFLKMPTKTTQKQFKELTGYDQSSSEHARDAATLVYGMSMRQAGHLAHIDAVKNQRVPKSYPAPHNGNHFLVKRKS